MKKTSRDSFWRRAYKIRYESRIMPEQTGREVAFLLRLLQRNGRILDYACGFGRHANALARAGLEVDGYDSDAESIGRAKAAARRPATRARLSFVRMDLLKFAVHDKYDGAICMYSSIGALTGRQNEVMFRNLLRAVKLNGIVVIDLMNPDWAIRNVRPMTRKTIKYDNRTYGVTRWRHVRHNPVREMNRIEIRSSDNRPISYGYSLRLYNRREIESILRRAGFAAIRWYGSYAAEPISTRHQRLIVVAKRIN